MVRRTEVSSRLQCWIPALGEVIERRLERETGEARSFYASLAAPAWVGRTLTQAVSIPAKIPMIQELSTRVM